MATSSPTRIDGDLDTGCLSSVLGRRMPAPAPLGLGFPLHEPSINATAVVVDIFYHLLCWHYDHH